MVKGYDCASETDGKWIHYKSLATCSSSCENAAKGRPGCCEWQEDHEYCIFVPGEKAAIPSVPESGGRHATDCFSDGTHKSCLNSRVHPNNRYKKPTNKYNLINFYEGRCKPLSQVQNRCGQLWGRCNKRLNNERIFCDDTLGDGPWCVDYVKWPDDAYNWNSTSCKGNKWITFLHY